MREFLAWLAILGVPILALLFVALRLRRRVRYPHDLLAIPDRVGLADLLPRSLRLYYDLAVDALCALAVAAAIAGFPPPAKPGPTTVIDCSRSMLAGLRGDRPLDLACAEFLSDAHGDSRLFLLDTDPESMKPRLSRASRSERASAADGPIALALALESGRIFLGQDHGLLASLGKAGYRDTRLLTDVASGQPKGVLTVEYGTRDRPLLYPASARRDGEYSVSRWLSRGGAYPLRLDRATDGGLFMPMDPSLYAITPAPGGYELRVREDGAFLLSWHGGSMPFTSFPRPPIVRAQGDLAESVRGVIGPWLAENWSQPDGSTEFWLGNGRLKGSGLRLSTAAIEDMVLDPESSMGRPVASAYVPGSRPGTGVGMGPTALASGESALAVLYAIYREREWALAPSRSSSVYEPKTARPSSPAKAAGDGYVINGAFGAVAIIAPATEYWQGAAAPAIAMPKPRAMRWPAALALAVLAAAKLLLTRAFRSRGSFGAASRQRQA